MAADSYPMAEAVRAAYRAGQEDETLEPLVRVSDQGQPVGCIQDGDYVIFYDIRGEREIELTSAFVDPEFPHFARPRGRTAHPMAVHFATMIEYHPDLDVQVAFPPPGSVQDTLAEVVSKAGLRQAKIVESEKAIHVSFFLNGKAQEPLPGEDRIVIPSPRPVVHAEMPPAMSAAAVADAAIEALGGWTAYPLQTTPVRGYALITVNLCNVDVIGHIENPEAIRTAVETVDAQAARIVEAARQAGVTTVLTADHGTVERWYYPDGAIDTGHTDSPVPFVLIEPDGTAAGGRHTRCGLRAGGALTDVAPTVLELMGLPQPAEMTGQSLCLSKDRYTSSRVAVCPEGTGASGAPASLRTRGHGVGRRRPSDPAHGQRRLDGTPVLLLILDGWGLGDGGPGDLIAQANTPFMDGLLEAWPNTQLEAAGPAVGMPAGTVGNSESGHLHIGAGRVVPADRVRINRALEDGSWFENEAFLWAMQGAKRDGTRLHLLGIVSFYSSHGSVDHLLALMEMARREAVPEVYIHSMLGRRGERPESGAIYIEQVEREAERLGVGTLATVIGRFWSLDREEHWDRIEKTYRMLVEGQGQAVYV
jgi:2,3-bisphosphoglycerate-independent phosphoglycerate mutase